MVAQPTLDHFTGLNQTAVVVDRSAHGVILQSPLDRFGEQSVEFLNVVTSAPSTIMAISAMMTSLPSYLIARNYDDFMFDNKFYTCLNEIVKKNDYFSMGFFRHMHPREKFQNLFDFGAILTYGKCLRISFEIRFLIQHFCLYTLIAGKIQKHLILSKAHWAICKKLDSLLIIRFIYFAQIMVILILAGVLRRKVFEGAG